MASLEQFEHDKLDELEDSFEIELSQLQGSARRPVFALWSARLPETVASPEARRRRYSRMAALMAVFFLVIINSLDLSGLLPAGLPLVSSSLSNSGLTARASGYSWVALRQRPLRLPKMAPGSACPVTPLSQMTVQLHTVKGIGDSTIFAVAQGMDEQGELRAVRSSFFHYAADFRGVLVTWYIRLPDVEPIYIRGAQLDGAHILRFDGGIEQPNFSRNLLGGSTLPQLLISSTSKQGSPIATWPSITRIQSSGCYAYQIDTPSKSMVLVFKATVDP